MAKRKHSSKKSEEDSQEQWNASTGLFAAPGANLAPTLAALFSSSVCSRQMTEADVNLTLLS